MICWACQSEVGKHIQRCPYCGAALEHDATDPMVGRRLGAYELLRKIGQGGMGVVYEAYHTQLQVSYALKLLHPNLSEDWVMVERLRREAVVAFQLQHQNIVQVLDYGWDEGLGFFLVMEMLRGEGLNALLVRQPVLPLMRVAQLVYQICEALELAHVHGVIHRDLKPGNVFLTNDLDNREQIKLLDFGIARLVDNQGQHELTRAGRSFGTPAYMPPEQVLSRSAEICPATDIYALSSMVYRMLTGVLPFKGKTMIDTLNKVMVQPTPRLSKVRPGLAGTLLDDILHQCMAKQSKQRLQSAQEFSQKFQEAVSEPQVRQFLRHDESERMVMQHEGVVPLETVNLEFENLQSKDFGIEEGETFIFDGATFRFDGRELVTTAGPTITLHSSQQSQGPSAKSALETINLEEARQWLDQVDPNAATVIKGKGPNPGESLRESMALLAAQKLSSGDSTLKLNHPTGALREYTPPSRRWLQGNVPKPSMQHPGQPVQNPEPQRELSQPNVVLNLEETSSKSWWSTGSKVVGGFLVGFVLIGMVLWGVQRWRGERTAPEEKVLSGGSAFSSQGRSGLQTDHYYLRVESKPTGAKVIEQGKVLGKTPLSLRRNRGKSLSFVVIKSGYEMSVGTWDARHDQRMFFPLRSSSNKPANQ